MVSSPKKGIKPTSRSQINSKASPSNSLLTKATNDFSLDLLDQILDSQFFNSLSEPSRVTVLKKIIELGRADVSKISEGLPLDKSVVSRHLTFLSEAGILIRKKVGKQVFYEPDPTNILKRFQDILDGIRIVMAKCCPPPMNED